MDIEAYILVAFGLLVLGGSGAMAYRTVRTWRAALAARTWPETAGTILATRIARHHSAESGVTTYQPIIAYEYAVGGQAYRSERRTFDPAPGGREQVARAVLARYPAGATVAVRYDPADPGEAVLETRVSGADLHALGTLMWLGFAAMGVGSIGLAFLA